MIHTTKLMSYGLVFLRYWIAKFNPNPEVPKKMSGDPEVELTLSMCCDKLES